MGALLMMLLFAGGVNGGVVGGVSDVEGMREPPHASEACSPLQLGSGAFWNGEWVQERWDPSIAGMINEKLLFSPHLEVYPMLMAARKWGHRWAGMHVIVFSDNTAAISAINTGTARNDIVMVWLRELFWLSAKLSFRVTARHLPGKFNLLADALSRFDNEKFCRARAQWSMYKRGNVHVLESAEWLRVLSSLSK
jgi:hypothetical protein